MLPLSRYAAAAPYAYAMALPAPLRRYAMLLFSILIFAAYAATLRFRRHA